METKTILFRYSLEPRNTPSAFEKVLRALTRAMFFWVPKASPDYDMLSGKVKYWYIEIELETGSAEREIGFDTLDNPIVYGPTERNLGFWTDSDKIFHMDEGEVLSKDSFEQQWKLISQRKAR